MGYFVLYLIGFVLTFVLVAFLNVKYKWKIDEEGAIVVSILWPVVLVAVIPFYLFIMFNVWSWKWLNVMFVKLVG
jgi:hypothetical protein